MNRIKIAPSILAWDLGDLSGAVDIAVKGEADQIHLDVIDGHFAPNVTFGPGTVRALRSRCDLKFDTHLMMDEPWKFADKFLDAGSDLLTVHAEVLDRPKFDELHSVITRRGKEIGLAIKPTSELPEWAMEIFYRLHALIVMTVNPGFSGQPMDLSVMPKLERIHSFLLDGGYKTDLEVDGGVEPENIHEVVSRGGNVLVAGAGIYSKKDPVMAISELRERAQAALKVA